MTDFVIPNSNAVTMSEAAIAHFKNTAAGKVVKFSVEGGGCAGFQYRWDVLDSTNDLYDDDEIIEYDDFIFAVDGASLMMLVGSQIDYLTDITGSHIEVNNPLAKAGCGCGVSIRFS